MEINISLFISISFSIFCIYLILKNTFKNYKTLIKKKNEYKLKKCINDLEKYNNDQGKFNSIVLELIDLYGKNVVLRAYCIVKKCPLKTAIQDIESIEDL